MPKELTQECQRCKQTKPLSEFYNNSTKPNWRNGICKSCQSEVNQR